MPNYTEEELKNMSPEQISELQKQNCIFCKMVAGEIPTYKVFEDDKVFAILDINPANEGHVLLLPKEHYQILPQVPPELLGHMMVIAKKISQMMLSIMRVKGTSILFEVGEAAGQKAPHVMMHIIPANPNNKILQPEVVSQDAQQFEQVLKLLRSKTGFRVQEKSPLVSTTQPVEEKEVVTNEPEKVSIKKELNKHNNEKIIGHSTKLNKSKDLLAPKEPDLDKISKLFG